MSRDSDYQLHRRIGVWGFFLGAGAAFTTIIPAILKLFRMDDASETPRSFALAFSSVAGFAIPIAFTFLSYARQVSRCHQRCPSDPGFYDCLNRIRLNPLAREPKVQGGDG